PQPAEKPGSSTQSPAPSAQNSTPSAQVPAPPDQSTEAPEQNPGSKEPCIAKHCHPHDTVTAPPKDNPEVVAAVSSGRLASAIREQPPCIPQQMTCRLNTKQRFMLFIRRSHNPYTFAGAGLLATYSQFTGERY